MSADDAADFSAPSSFASQARAIRSQANDVFSRLRSIESDAAFVRDVVAANPSLPLVGELNFPAVGELQGLTSG